MFIGMLVCVGCAGLGANVVSKIAANPHPNLPPQAGEGAIVSPPACRRGLRGGLAPLLGEKTLAASEVRQAAMKSRCHCEERSDAAVQQF